MSEAKTKPPGEADEAHPELFDIRAMPPQPAEKKPGQLPESMIRQFFEEGYIVVDKLFTPEELEPCRVACADQVEQLANMLYKAGKIKSLYKEFGLFQRLTQIEKEFPGATILAIKLSGKLSQAYRDLWSNPRLLNVIEQLIGPDIMANPVWTLRPKAPQDENTVVPWHQDAGYFDNRAYQVMQITGWIPLLDTNRENGCMEVVTKGHLKGKVATHQNCWRDTWYIMLDEKEMENSLGVSVERDSKVVPVPYGGILLFSNVLPHRSLPNLSNDIRWSLDFRWQRAGTDIGFYDMLEGVLMRSKDNPDLRIDWEPIDKVNRHLEAMGVKSEDQALDESAFNTTVTGPWMKKWDIVHQNRHTAKFLAQEA